MRTKMIRLVILLLGSILMSQFIAVPSVMADSYGKTIYVSSPREVGIDEMDVNTFPSSDITITNIRVKNGAQFVINLNNIADLKRISNLSGGNLIGNNEKVAVANAGRVSFVYYTQTSGGNEQGYLVFAYVNYYGVLQYQGSDAPASIDVTLDNQ
ncbi:hypothetical protein, partial [Tannerella forsythia]